MTVIDLINILQQYELDAEVKINNAKGWGCPVDIDGVSQKDGEDVMVWIDIYGKT